MQVRRVGYGAGTADPAQWANVLRVFIGDAPASGVAVETIVEPHTNLGRSQSASSETVFERLFAAGAVDATLAPVTMKKGRLGTVLSVLAPREQVEAVLAVLFSDTTALGVRTQDVQRRVAADALRRSRSQGVTCGSKWRIINRGSKAAPEYDDCKRIAEQSGRPVKDILEEVDAGVPAHAGRNETDDETRMSRRCYPNTSSRKTALCEGACDHSLVCRHVCGFGGHHLGWVPSSRTVLSGSASARIFPKVPSGVCSLPSGRRCLKHPFRSSRFFFRGGASRWRSVWEPFFGARLC